jgi:hypothetical protein
LPVAWQAKPNLKVSLFFRWLGLMAPPPHDPYLGGQQSRAAPRFMATTLDGKDPTGLIRAFVSSIGITCRHPPGHWILCDGSSSAASVIWVPRYKYGWRTRRIPHRMTGLMEFQWGRLSGNPPSTLPRRPRQGAIGANLYTGPGIGYFVGIYGRPQRRLSQGS